VPCRRRSSRSWLVLLLALLLPSAALADGTSCLILPPEGSFPPQAREYRQQLLEAEPEHACGFVARTEAIQQARRQMREGLIDEGDVPPHQRALTGDLRVLVLPMLFSNTPAEPWNPVSLEAQLFLFGPTGTMAQYYDEVSYGNLNITGDVFGWMTLDNPDTYYEKGEQGLPGRTGNLAEETFTDQDVAVNYALYDNDGPDNVPNSGDDDGYVDVVFVVHPEIGGECMQSTTNIWSQQAYYSNSHGAAFVTNDNSANGGKIRIERFCLTPAQNCTGGMIDIGVFCHELGHAIGIKDLYDTDANLTGNSDGIGVWGLMGAGNWNSTTSPAHMTAWTKHRLGWLTYLNLTQDDDNLCLPPVELNPTAIRLWPYGEPSSEYFLVENRQWIGFDTGLMQEGLIIYHVDDARYDATSFQNEVNADETRKSLDIECADAWAIGNGVDSDDLDVAGDSNNGDATDVWCQEGGGTIFSNTTTPWSRSNNNSYTGIAVRNVSACDGGGGALPNYVCAEYDVGNASTIDVCIRDCAGGDCNAIATCNGWWGSPDIWIDHDGDGDDDYPFPGIDVKLWTRVTNDGPGLAVGTTAQIWIARGAMGLVWPDDADQMVGVTGHPVIETGESDVASLVFEYPEFPEEAGHYCIGAVLQQTDDPTNSLPANLTNNIAQVNHQVLMDRGSLGEPARSDGVTSCGSAFLSTWILLYDGENPDQNSVAAEVRMGTPPNFDDAIIPPGWNVSFEPQMGPFFLSPAENDSVMVSLWTNSATHGDVAYLPLTLWNLDTNEAMGGTTLEARIDCVSPGIVTNLTADWRPPSGDDMAAPNVLVEWTPVTVDEGGDAEDLLYYQVSRAPEGGLLSVIDRVTIDAEPGTPGFQFYDRVPSADCPTHWDYAVRAIDAADGWGAGTTFRLECNSGTTDAPVVAQGAAGDRLFPAEPNPMRNSTAIRFEMARAGQAEVSIYNARGERVRQLWKGPRTAGTHRLAWDGRGDGGQQLASGIYFTRAALPGGVETRKIVLMR